MALGVNKPQQSMAATSTKNIYDVFFGSKSIVSTFEGKPTKETQGT
jgi:hypothetical protein